LEDDWWLLKLDGGFDPYSNTFSLSLLASAAFCSSDDCMALSSYSATASPFFFLFYGFVFTTLIASFYGAGLVPALAWIIYYT